MLLPQELKKKSFTRAMRGYEPAEVDEFVEFLVEKYSEVYTQCDRYDKKLRLVADRISQIQSEEEAIKKLAVSTQKLCENMTAEAEEEARRITGGANAEAEAIITEARERAEAVLASINQKSEEKISFIERKSDELLLSVRTKCAGILNDFKKDIAAQKESIISLKNITEDFHNALTETYKKHISELENNVPELKIDLDSFNESKLLADIMNDIKNDAVKIANDEQWSSNSDFDADLEKLKAGTYANAAEKVGKNIDENEKRGSVEKTADDDMGSTKTMPIQKPVQTPAAGAASNERGTEEFDMVKYKSEMEKPVHPNSIDEKNDSRSIQNEPDGEDDADDEDNDNGGGYDESGNAGEYDAYEEDDADDEAEPDDEADKRGGKKKGFLGLFKRDKPEKNHKYNDDIDDNDDDYDDDDYDDDDDDDYYGLKNNDSRRTESSIFDD